MNEFLVGIVPSVTIFLLQHTQHQQAAQGEVGLQGKSF